MTAKDWNSGFAPLLRGLAQMLVFLWTKVVENNFFHSQQCHEPSLFDKKNGTRSVCVKTVLTSKFILWITRMKLRNSTFPSKHRKAHSSTDFAENMDSMILVTSRRNISPTLTASSATKTFATAHHPNQSAWPCSSFSWFSSCCKNLLNKVQFDEQNSQSCFRFSTQHVFNPLDNEAKWGDLGGRK